MGLGEPNNCGKRREVSFSKVDVIDTKEGALQGKTQSTELTARCGNDFSAASQGKGEKKQPKFTFLGKFFSLTFPFWDFRPHTYAEVIAE